MKVIKPNTIAYPDGSFSRGTIGTYFDALGVMQTAAINAPRFTYNPSTLAFEGLLIEPASTNLLLYSAQFDNAAWNKANITITPNNTIAPDGTLTADLCTTTATIANFYQSFTATSTAFTYTIYTKPGTLVDAYFTIYNNTTATGYSTGIFNSVSKTISGTGWTATSVGNNWYRLSYTCSTGVNIGNTVSVYAGVAGGSYPVGSNWYVWGAQVEAGSKATSYIATTGTSVLRNADVITGTGLIYTTATDPNPLYSSGTTYALDAVVRYNGVIYQSLQTANTNHQPDISTAWWFELYADNMHAAFDTQTSTVSSATTSLTFVVKCGSFDSVALINLEAKLAHLAVSDYTTKTLVYSGSVGLSEGTLQDWYEYFFNDPFVRRTQAVLYNIPKYAQAVATIRVESEVGDIASVAQAVFGTISELGGTQYGAQAGIIDYSRKDTDEFGTTTFVKRSFSKRLTADIYINNSELNRVQNYLYNIRATPIVWIASDDPQLEEVSVVWGFYRDFSTTISYPSHSLCNIQIEGLT